MLLQFVENLAHVVVRSREVVQIHHIIEAVNGNRPVLPFISHAALALRARVRLQSDR